MADVWNVLEPDNCKTRGGRQLSKRFSTRKRLAAGTVRRMETILTRHFDILFTDNMSETSAVVQQNPWAENVRY